MSTRGPDDPLMLVHLSDLTALVQTSTEVLHMLAAIVQEAPGVPPTKAAGSAHALVALMVRRLTTLPHVPVRDP